MTDHFSDPDLNVRDLTTIIEEFTTIFIRLPSVERLSFTTLSVLHTLSRKWCDGSKTTDCSNVEQIPAMAVRCWYNLPHVEHRSSKYATPRVWSGSPACSTACPQKNVRPLHPPCQLWPIRSN